MAIGSLYNSFLTVARRRGVDVDAVLREHDLCEEEILKPTTRLSPEQGKALGAALVGCVQDPAYGLLAARAVQLEDLELLGYLSKNAPNLAAMLDMFERYARLLGDTAACDVVWHQDRVTVHLGRTGGRKLLLEASDFAAAVLVRVVRELTPSGVGPLRVHLPRRRPDDGKSFRAFFGVPVEFEAECAAVEYERSALSVPFADADTRLLGILRRQADGEVASLPPNSNVVERVRAFVDKRLQDGDCRLDEVARHFRMSERTLRRRLRDEGSGYRELVDDVRRERALLLMDQGGQSATAIAMQVGFGDSSTFARAFRRWTGVFPSEYPAKADTRT